MVRSPLAWAAVCLVALTAGCRMCAHPYDYCGPTFTAAPGQECMPNARACSILSPGAPSCRGCEVVPGMMVPVPDVEAFGSAAAANQPRETAATVRPQRRTAAVPGGVK